MVFPYHAACMWSWLLFPSRPFHLHYTGTLTCVPSQSLSPPCIHTTVLTLRKTIRKICKEGRKAHMGATLSRWGRYWFVMAGAEMHRRLLEGSTLPKFLHCNNSDIQHPCHDSIPCRNSLSVSYEKTTQIQSPESCLFLNAPPRHAKPWGTCFSQFFSHNHPFTHVMCPDYWQISQKDRLQQVSSAITALCILMQSQSWFQEV